MPDSTIVFIVLGCVLALFISNRVPIEIVAVGNALALWMTGVLDFDQALPGFGDPVVVYIAALLVVTNALETTGLSAWAGQRLGTWSGRRRSSW